MVRYPISRCLAGLVAALVLAGCAAQRAYREGNDLIAHDQVEAGLLKYRDAVAADPANALYKVAYLRARDAAYHQGTVWAWLIGPFIDGWLKVHPNERAEARKFLAGFEPHLDEACIGSISEIFDAEPPYTPRGCIAQAWSVAEVLRCWAKTGKAGGGE